MWTDVLLLLKTPFSVEGREKEQYAKWRFSHTNVTSLFHLWKATPDICWDGMLSIWDILLSSSKGLRLFLSSCK